MELIEAELSERIIGCGIKVHRSLGPGFLEKVYEEALAIELANAALDFHRQKVVPIVYEGRPVGEHRLDFLVSERVELKACKSIERISIWPRLGPNSKLLDCRWLLS